MRWFWIGLTIGISVVAVLWYQHYRCPTCQERSKQMHEQWDTFVSKARHWLATGAHGFGNSVAE